MQYYACLCMCVNRWGGAEISGCGMFVGVHVKNAPFPRHGHIHHHPLSLHPSLTHSLRYTYAHQYTDIKCPLSQTRLIYMHCPLSTLPLSFSLSLSLPPLSLSPLKGLTKDHMHSKSKPNPSRRMALSPTTACIHGTYISYDRMIVSHSMRTLYIYLTIFLSSCFPITMPVEFMRFILTAIYYIGSMHDRSNTP